MHLRTCLFSTKVAAPDSGEPYANGRWWISVPLPISREFARWLTVLCMQVATMVDEHQEEVGRLHEYIQARSPPVASCLTVCQLKPAPIASLQARQSSQAQRGDSVAQGAYHPVCAVCGRAPTSRLGYGAAVCARGGAVLRCSGSFVCAPSCRGASPLHHPTGERTPNSLQRSWPCGTRCAPGWACFLSHAGGRRGAPQREHGLCFAASGGLLAPGVASSGPAIWSQLSLSSLSLCT